MTISSQDIFAWAGAMLINIAFIYGVFYASWSAWYIGVIVSAVYTVILFLFARFVESRKRENGADENEGSSRAAIPNHRLASFLYGLAVVSTGVTGVFLPINLVGNCELGNPSYVSPYANYRGTWVTKITEEVPSFAQRSEQASFIHMSGTTLFEGRTTTSQHSSLWVTTANGTLTEFGHFERSTNFVEVNENTLCFTWGSLWVSNRSIGCYDIGADGERANEPYEIESTRDFVDFVGAIEAADGLLWFTARSQDVKDDAIGSINVTTLETTLTSVLQNATSDEASDNYNCPVQTLRVRSILLLFTSAIPVLALSILMWKKKGIASMGVTTLLGVLEVYSLICYAASPRSLLLFSDANIGWVIIGALCCIVYLPVAVKDEATPPLHHGVAAATLTVILGLYFVLNGWFLYPVLLLVCAVPFSILGAVSDNWMVSFVGAGTTLACAVRLGIYAGGLWAIFPAFVIGWLIVGGWGVLLAKVKAPLKKQLASLFGASSTSSTHQQTQPDHTTTTGSEHVDLEDKP